MNRQYCPFKLYAQCSLLKKFLSPKLKHQLGFLERNSHHSYNSSSDWNIISVLFSMFRHLKIRWCYLSLTSSSSHDGHTWRCMNSTATGPQYKSSRKSTTPSVLSFSSGPTYRRPCTECSWRGSSPYWAGSSSLGWLQNNNKMLNPDGISADHTI